MIEEGGKDLWKWNFISLLIILLKLVVLVQFRLRWIEFLMSFGFHFDNQCEV